MSTVSQDDSSALLRVAASFGLVVGGFGLAIIFGVFLGVGALLSGAEIDPGVFAVLDVVLTQGALAIVALAFLVLVVGRSFVSVRVPTSSEAVVIGGGLAVAVALEASRQLAVRFTDLSMGGTMPVEEEIAAWAVVSVLAMVVLLAPLVEELLFRGLVQRWVAEASSTAVGIAVATVLFVPTHAIGIALATPTLAGAATVVVVLIGVSIVLGVAYARTDNLAVPILIHSGYNLAAIGIAIAVFDESVAAGWLPLF